MTRLVDLTVALSSHDHTLDLIRGAVQIAGTSPDFVELPIPEMSSRCIEDRRWDVSEVPLVDYAMRRSAGDDGIVAIPVFTSRMFHHRSIFVRGDRIAEPGDLRGRRVGTPAWSSSTGVWARGMLADMYGLRPSEIEWWQGEIDGPVSPGVAETPGPPAGVTLHRAEGRGLVQMLWAGELDALIAPAAPERVRASGDTGVVVRPLFADAASAERAYFRATGCLPPIDTIAIRGDVLAEHPWIASNLYRAFEVAKRRYFVRLTEISASRTPIPWTAAYVAEARELYGPDLWPYGVAGNRRSLEVFLRYGAEQGLVDGRLTVDELFAAVEPFVDGLL